MFGVKQIRNMFRRSGYDVNRWGLMKLFKAYEINQVFDVGANVGNYATGLRATGYAGEIFSFECVAAPFAELKAKASADKNWMAFNVGLGSEEATTCINVAGNSESSSLLNMCDRHLEAAPESKYIGKETVNLVTLESLINKHTRDASRLFVKIDTQGSEHQVLQGLGDQVSKVVGLQVELSLVQLYEGEVTLSPMLDYINGLGFTLMSVEPGYSDRKTGQLLQLDGIFFCENP